MTSRARRRIAMITGMIIGMLVSIPLIALTLDMYGASSNWWPASRPANVTLDFFEQTVEGMAHAASRLIMLLGVSERAANIMAALVMIVLLILLLALLLQEAFRYVRREIAFFRKHWH